MPAVAQQPVEQAATPASRSKAAAAPRALGQAVGLAEQDGRPARLLDDARRDDADHAGVPVGRRQHDRRRQPVGQPGERFAQDDHLDLLALGVERAETLRQGQGRGAVGGAEQLDDLRGVLETPGGVQTRRQAKADGRRVDVVGPRLAHLEQGGQTGRGALRRRPMPIAARLGSRRAAAPRRPRCRQRIRRGRAAGRAAARRGRRDGLRERVGQLEGDADAGR